MDHFGKFSRLPFNWKSPILFLAAVTVKYIGTQYILIVDACAVSLAVGTFCYALASSKCLKGSLFKFNRNARAGTNLVSISEHLAEFIRFHSQVLQLSGMPSTRNQRLFLLK